MSSRVHARRWRLFGASLRTLAIGAVLTLVASASALVAAISADGTDATDPVRDPLMVRAAGADITTVAPQTALEQGTAAPRLPGTAAEGAKAQRQAEEPEPVVAAAPTVASGSVWDRLAMCESSGNWASTVGMFEGGLQFHPSTWDAYKPAGYPAGAYEASRSQQIAVAERVLAAQGWNAWPSCARQLGLL